MLCSIDEDRKHSKMLIRPGWIWTKWHTHTTNQYLAKRPNTTLDSQRETTNLEPEGSVTAFKTRDFSLSRGWWVRQWHWRGSPRQQWNSREQRLLLTTRASIIERPLASIEALINVDDTDTIRTMSTIGYVIEQANKEHNSRNQ